MTHFPVTETGIHPDIQGENIMSMKNVTSLPAEVLVQAQKEFLMKVYAWMVGGLLLTGVTAFAFASSEALMSAVWGNPILRLVAILAPLGMVLAISGGINRLNSGLASLMFLGYSVLTGVMLSAIFVTYDPASIATTFFITSGTFAVMSVYGFVTKTDLSAMGSFLLMGVIGLILAMVVNWIIGSPALHFAISAIGVLIFTGLTAYDTQRLKEAYVPGLEVTEEGRKTAIVGALSLYLNFINLFLFLLRLLGGRR